MSKIPNKPISSPSEIKTQLDAKVATRVPKHEKKIGFFTKLLSRKINKGIDQVIKIQLTQIDSDMNGLKVSVGTSKPSSPERKTFTHQLEVLKAKKELIVEVNGLNKEIQDILGDDRNIGLAYAASLLSEGKTWTAVDNVVYKIISNQGMLTRIFSKITYAIAKFIIKIAVSGAKKENYQITADELKQIQDVVAKRLNVMADKGVGAGLTIILDNVEGLNKKQKTLIKDVVKTSLTELNEVFGTEDNPNNVILVTVANVLKQLNFDDMKEILKARLPAMVDTALETKFIQGKTKEFLSNLTGEELLPLVEIGYDFATVLVNDLFVENPNYTDPKLIKGSVDKIHTAFEKIKDNLGKEFIQLLQLMDKTDTKSGKLNQWFKTLAVKSGVKLENKVEFIDMALMIVSRTVQKIGVETLRGFVETTLKKHISILMKNVKENVDKTLSKKRKEALQADDQLLIDFMSKTIASALQADLKSTKDLKHADIIKIGMNIYGMFENVVITGLIDSKKYDPTDLAKLKALPKTVADNLAKQFLLAMEEHEDDITLFPTYIKAHKTEFSLGVAGGILPNVVKLKRAKTAVKAADILTDKVEQEALTLENLKLKLENLNKLYADILNKTHRLDGNIKGYFLNSLAIYDANKIVAIKRADKKKAKLLSPSWNLARKQINATQNLIKKLQSENKALLKTIEKSKNEKLEAQLKSVSNLFAAIAELEKAISNKDVQLDKMNNRIDALNDRVKNLMA